MNKEPKTLQELFSKDGSWNQFALAKTKDDKPILDSIENICYHPKAISWCLVGGTIKIYKQDARKYLIKIKKRIKSSITKWNNSPKRTIEDIRKLVKELNI